MWTSMPGPLDMADKADAALCQFGLQVPDALEDKRVVPG